MRAKGHTYAEPDVTRAWTMADPLNFTRYFFTQRTHKRFVVGDHHRRICARLADVLRGDCRRLIINIAPRYGKTELAVKSFIAMGLAMNPASRFLHLSYSGSLAQDNSVAIKDIVTNEEFMRLFPLRIMQGRDTKARWDTEQGGGVYATSTLGQITGFGAGAVDVPGEPFRFAGAIVIDDPIKPEDALSDLVRESVNRRFETTIRNRVNSRSTPIVIIMQRVHERDLCGYLTSIEPDEWEVLSLPCLTTGPDGRDRALWEFKHTAAELRAIEASNAFVFETQYQQNPKPLEGLMYSRFSTYQELPVTRREARRRCYTDTADTGADFLCSVCYLETPDAVYVTDVLYTDRPMEYTEPATARMLVAAGVHEVIVESNNGGRGFARNVEAAVRRMGDTRMAFRTFTQTANKKSRIFSHSAEVQNIVRFPEDWQSRWPQFYSAMAAYRKEGGNAHDDAPDAATGIVEWFGKGLHPVDRAEVARAAF